MPLRIRHALTAVLVATLGMSGCATAGHTFRELSLERDQLRTLREALDSASGLPSADLMAVDAQLVTYRFTVGDSSSERRDTIRGAEAVSSWLQAWDARPDVTFRLAPDNVQSCRGATIQTGSYPIPGAKARDAEVRQPYRALWLSDATGRLVLHRVWLEPDARARAAVIATQCRSLRELELATRRVTVTFEGVLSRVPAADEILEAMRDANWVVIKRKDIEPFPTGDTEGNAIAAGISYRLIPSFRLRAAYLQFRGAWGTGHLNAPLREPTLRVDDQLAALLGVFELGWAQFGAGPAVATVNYGWTERIDMVEAAPVSKHELRYGGLAEASVQFPGARWGGPYVALRYAVMPAAHAPPFYDLDGVAISLRRLSLGAGFAVAF
jgi:hypothetical protein